MAFERNVETSRDIGKNVKLFLAEKSVEMSKERSVKIESESEENVATFPHIVNARLVQERIEFVNLERGFGYVRINHQSENVALHLQGAELSMESESVKIVGIQRTV